MRTIQGGQSNGLDFLFSSEPECIRVQKVYDWTTAQTQDQREICPPLECITALEAFIAANPGVFIQASCTAPIPDLSLPIAPGPAPTFCPSDQLCCLEIGREDVTLTDGTQAQLVATVSSVPLHIELSSNSTIICEFDTHVKLFEKNVLCAPTGTQVLCRITQIICDAVLLNPDQIVVNVSICKELQVEAEVKLEVIASFCRPRAPIAPDILPLPCPPVGQFPPQCPSIFPDQNCDFSLNGFIQTLNAPILIGINTRTGIQTLSFALCPQASPCNIRNSEMRAVFQLEADPHTGEPAETLVFEATYYNPVTTSTQATGSGTFNGKLVNWTLVILSIGRGSSAQVTLEVRDALTNNIEFIQTFIGDSIDDFVLVNSCS